MSAIVNVHNIVARDIFYCLLRFKEQFALTALQKFEELNKYPDFNNYLIFVLTKLVSEGKERSATQQYARYYKI